MEEFELRAALRREHPPAPRPDAWANEVAKWFAVVVLGAIGTVGLIWSIWFRPMPARLERAETANVPRVTLDATRSGAGPREERAVETGERQERAPKAVLTGTIDINAAGLAELQLLPGIGPALAQRIVEDREKNGPYLAIENLDRVKGIGPKTLEKLRPLVRVN